MKHVLLPELGHYAHFMHRDKMHNPYPLRKIGHKKPFVPPVTQLPVDSTNNGAVSCPIDGNDTLGCCGEAMACHVFNIFTYGQGKPGFTEVSFNESSLVKQYEKVSGGDNGLNEDEVVNEIEKVGVAGNKEMVITSALDINVNNVAMARWALDNFYTIQMAWSVPDNFIQKFTVNPVTVWPNYMTPDPENGHFTVLSDVGGPNDTLNGINLNGFYRNWTWGGYAWVSPHFVESVQPQCFIVFSPRQFSSETGYDSKGRHITVQAALWAEAGGSPVPTRIIEQFPGVN